MKKVHESEIGQVLILLTFGIITLLGFTALAIDGGRVYSERRHAQGIADTSSLTGALYIAQQKGAITSSILDSAKNSAIFRANSNGYSSDGQTTVDVSITRKGSYYFVRTEIHSAVDPVIAQIVYDGPLNVKVVSVARVFKLPTSSTGHALYAMNKTKKNALWFTGNGEIMVFGSGIYSNSNDPNYSITFAGSSSTTIEDLANAVGGINVAGTVLNTDGTTFTGYNSGVEQSDNPLIPTPDCSGLGPGVKSQSGSVVNFTPGTYGGISENGHNTYHFEPGMYCIDGVFTTKNGVFEGNNVFFYVRNGDVSLAGDVQFYASTTNGVVKDNSGENWNGMLLYLGLGSLTINGNSNSDYRGTVYVPTPANPSCKLNGTSDSEGFAMQLMCDTIRINGDGKLLINYNEEYVYVPPVVIDLDQ
ncbi:MAG: pilus assembly protein TadG-related protein [Anaerolineales bacterium]